MPRIRLLRYPATLSRKARRSRLLTMSIALATLLLFLTPFYAIYKPPALLIRLFQRKWPDVLFHVDGVGEKVVALTIDDAPSGFTEEILGILRENEVQATFFIIGAQVSGREGVLRRVVEEGMEVGNHAMHDEAARSLADAELERQIGEVDARISRAYEDAQMSRPEARLFRPGSGFFSQRMRRLVPRLGYRIVLGDIYPHDPQIPYWRVNARHVLSMLRPGGIVICHDRRSWTVPMLRYVLPEMKRRGWRVTTVSGLLAQAEMEKKGGDVKALG